jgi:hypothetical protein
VRPSVEAYLELGPAAQDALRIAQESGMCEAAAAVVETWEPSSLIHGDVRPANILVDATRDQAADVRLIDWEFAAAGDPRWDLGCLAGHALHLWLTSIPTDTDSPAPAAATTPLAAVAAFIRSTWDAYRRAGGRGARRDDGGVAAMRFAGVALLDVALAIGRGADRLTRSQVLHLQAADNLLSRPDAACEQFFGQLAAAAA